MKRRTKPSKREFTEEQLYRLVYIACHSQEQNEEERRAEALLLLADEIEHDSGMSNSSEIIKKAAFAMCCDETMESQI
jgi:hypothetical protein